MPRKKAREAAFKSPLKECRPGVVRKTNEWPTEVWLRLAVAARARGIFTSVLLRAIAIDWLREHALSPSFAAPPVEVSPEAFAIARSLGDGNDAAKAMLGPGAAQQVAEIFGFKKEK